MAEVYKFWKGHRVRLVNPREQLLTNPPMQCIEYAVEGRLETGYAFVHDLTDEPVEADLPAAPLSPVHPLIVALLAASDQELALRVVLNETADKILNRTGQHVSMAEMETAKQEYMKALVTLHHEVRDWMMGVGPRQEG